MTDNMSNDHVVALLSDFLEGDLSERDCGIVELHLAACAECARALDQLRQTIALLGRMPKTMPPESG